MWKNLGFGLGYRSPLFEQIIDSPKQVDWFEIVSENYMGLQDRVEGRSLKLVQRLREDYPLVIHGVSMSIGSTDPLDMDYLTKLKRLIERVEPEWVSDHFCFTGVGHRTVHDLLPLPYTRAAVDHVVNRIFQVQDFLKRPLVFENVSSYLTYKESEMPEWDFISEICLRSGCGLLLDVNNVYVSAVNHNFNPMEYIQNIPSESVVQYHLAGHSVCGNHLIDTHDQPVCEDVWNLFYQTVGLIGARSTMIERDDQIPTYFELVSELGLARHWTLQEHQKNIGGRFEITP